MSTAPNPISDFSMTVYDRLIPDTVSLPPVIVAAAVADDTDSVVCLTLAL